MGPAPLAREPGAYLAAEGLPPHLRRTWQGRAPLISRAAWEARGMSVDVALTSIGIEGRAGPFVRVTITTTRRAPRAGMAPEGYASGHTVYLVKIRGAWIVVGSGRSWIT